MLGPKPCDQNDEDKPKPAFARRMTMVSQKPKDNLIEPESGFIQSLAEKHDEVKESPSKEKESEEKTPNKGEEAADQDGSPIKAESGNFLTELAAKPKLKTKEEPSSAIIGD